MKKLFGIVVIALIILASWAVMNQVGRQWAQQIAKSVTVPFQIAGHMVPR